MMTSFTANLVRETPFAVICESLSTPGNYYLVSRLTTREQAKETVQRLNRSFLDRRFDYHDLRALGEY